MPDNGRTVRNTSTDPASPLILLGAQCDLCGVWLAEHGTDCP